jgi:beta-lactam-binding protein with PASTA domain
MITAVSVAVIQNMERVRSPIPVDAPNVIMMKAQQQELCLTNANFRY